jgi:glyoxylase-like metal-dependent hydrolase (beta-lactamase superfamily II)
MDVQELAPGLWRWTAPHPDWREGADWPRDVGCVYYEAPDAVVLFDPQLPRERETFLSALDRDVGRLGRPVAILLTVPWHARSAEELAERYSARLGGAVTGVVELPYPDLGESVYWLPEHATLVVGESLVGADGGRLAPCPEAWLAGKPCRDVRASLRTLLELPVERILVSHGEPVLERGREALASALAG